MTARTTVHTRARGVLRFCNEVCHDSYRTDQRYGVFTLPRDFANEGFCMYCTDHVPTNNERRLEVQR